MQTNRIQGYWTVHLTFAAIVLTTLAGCTPIQPGDVKKDDGTGPVNASTIQSQAIGCFLGASASASTLATLAATGQIYFPSGNAGLDNFNQIEGLNLVSTYGASPRMYYLVDSPPNAYATPEVANAFGPDGTILFGQNLLARELAQDPSGASVIAVMAHEFAHLLQFRNGFRETGKRPELHADFMAGWYLKLRGRYAWTNLMPALRVFYQIGDFNFNSPTHHGTPDERLAAAQAGFNSPSQTAPQAYAAGLQFVK